MGYSGYPRGLGGGTVPGSTILGGMVLGNTVAGGKLHPGGKALA